MDYNNERSYWSKKREEDDYDYDYDQIKPVSFFEEKKTREKMFEALAKISLSDQKRRLAQGKIPLNGVLISKEKRAENISFIRDQLELMTLSMEFETKSINKQMGIDETPIYSKDVCLLSNLYIKLEDGGGGYICDSSLEMKPKVLILVQSPSLNQLNESPYIEEIVNEMQNCGVKSFQFLFLIPIFVGSGELKSEICIDRRFTKSLLFYTKDVILNLDPDIMVAVGAFCFEKAINCFIEKPANTMIFKGGSRFFSEVNDSLRGECFISLVETKKIQLFNLPHPFLVFGSPYTKKDINSFSLPNDDDKNEDERPKKTPEQYREMHEKNWKTIFGLLRLKYQKKDSGEQQQRLKDFFNPDTYKPKPLTKEEIRKREIASRPKPESSSERERKRKRQEKKFPSKGNHKMVKFLSIPVPKDGPKSEEKKELK